jgi:hypothetical protein
MQHFRTMVLLHGRARKPADVLERTWRAVGARLRCGAIKLLELRLGQIEVGAEHIPEDEPLEGGVMGGDGVQILDAIPHSLREGLVRRPEFDLAVVQRPGHAEHLRGRMLRVGVSAKAGQVTL